MRPIRRRGTAAVAAVALGLGTSAACVADVGPAGPSAPGDRCTTIASAANRVVESSAVFVGGDRLADVYRIPSVVTTSNGVVVAFAEARPGLADPGSGDIEIAERRSLDCGRTWTSPVVVADAGTGDAHNPTAVALPGGRVLLAYGKRPASAGGEFDLPTGFGPRAARMFVRVSDDDGATWGAEREVTASVKDASWRVASFGPGQGIVTRWGIAGTPAGRIVVPGWFSDDAGGGSFVALSDDGGGTWRRRSLPNGGTDEPQVYERTDGTLVLDGRAPGSRRLFTSADGGDTWSGPTAGLRMAPITAGVLRDRARRDGDATDRLLHSGIAPDGRSDARVWASRDEGETWARPVVLTPGFAQYSLLTELPDRSAAMVVETFCWCDDGAGGGPRAGFAIRFLRFDPDQLP